MPSALDVANKLRQVKAQLANAQEFYFSVLPQWTELARVVTRDVLSATRPADMSEETWARESEATVQRVAARLIGEDLAGVIIGLGATAPGLSTEDPKGFSVGGLGIREIEQFVAAGRAGDPLGKDVTRFPAQDAGKSDLQIAWRIAYAIKLRKPGYEQVREHVLKFLGHVALEAAEQQYSEVLKAWLAVFIPRARADFAEWVGRRVASALR